MPSSSLYAVVLLGQLTASLLWSSCGFQVQFFLDGIGRALCFPCWPRDSFRAFILILRVCVRGRFSCSHEHVLHSTTLPLIVLL